MPELNYDNVSDRVAIHKKYKLYVDITFKDGELEISQRLNSFFGQVGVYEGGEVIVKFVEDYVKNDFFDFFDFDSEKNVDYDALLEEQSLYSSINCDFLDDASVENNLDYELVKKADNSFYKNSSDEDLDDEYYDEESTIDDFQDQNLVVFLPLCMLFYFGDKKVDFFMFNSFKKRSLFNRQKLSICINYLRYKEFFSTYIWKSQEFLKISDYLKLIKFAKVSNYNLRNFFKLLNITNLDFMIDEDKLKTINEEYWDLLTKRKKRVFYFKKIFRKNRLTLLSINKKAKWLFSRQVINVVFDKIMSFNNKIMYSSVYEFCCNLFSQIYLIKKTFLKRFKRRKRFKNKMLRNFFGKRFVPHKVLNDVIDDSKKKKRR